MAMNAILVGLAAGIASAVLTLPLVAGAPLGLILFIVAPLPIAIAALGWHHGSGLVATLAGAAVTVALFGVRNAFGFTVGIALPMWWLAYLALLARPVAETERGEPVLEWYPIGRLVIWTAALGAVLVFAQILLVAGSVEEFEARLRIAVEALMRREAGPAAPGTERVVDFIVALLPPLGAAMFTIITLANLWLGARVVRASNRLKRPWPALSAMGYPRLALPALAAALGASLMEGLAGMAGELLAATLLIAYALLGLALIHLATRGFNARALLLTVFYSVLFLQSWLVLLVSLLGVADQLLGLRARILRRSGPGGGAGPNPSLT